MNKPEILAPAGSMDALRAAVNAGADAVYLGGSRFGARAYAGNFDQTELLEGIRFAHLYGVKVYLTVNTLFRNEEMQDLYAYLLPYYEAGLDAVIVQDLGVMKAVHTWFDKLPIHASTQMTILTPYSYRILHNYGVTRIVPARELSIDELRNLKEGYLISSENAPEQDAYKCEEEKNHIQCSTKEPEKQAVHLQSEKEPEKYSVHEQHAIELENIPSTEENILNGQADAQQKLINIPELEVFVQGALCVCYSGQCLMSSFIGGRSGNRGRCAQSCRLPFSLYGENGEQIQTDGAYLLSPKDLCGLHAISELMDAGVDSFKIEGRMKKPEYVAACVRSYRRCVDALWELMRDRAYKGNQKSDVSKDYEGQEKYINENIKKLMTDSREEMAAVFNRGGFTSGYFHQKNGRDMMSFTASGHIGTEIGAVTLIKKKQIGIKLVRPIHKGDILVLPDTKSQITLTSNVEDLTGHTISLNVPNIREIKNGMSVRRMLDAPLTEVLNSYIHDERKRAVRGKVWLVKNEPAKMTVTYCVKDKHYEVTCVGQPVEDAQAKPLTKEIVRDKIGQIGNTAYIWEELDIAIDQNVFYPLKALKELRREAFSMLEEKIAEEYCRRDGRTVQYDSSEQDTDVERRSNTKITDALIQNRSVTRNNVVGFENDAIRSADTDWEGNAVINKRIMRVMVSNMEQLAVVQDYAAHHQGRDGGERDLKLFIAVDLQYFEKRDIITLMREHPEYSYALPMVMRASVLKELRTLPLSQCHSLIVRSLDELSYLKELGYGGEVITDYTLYAMNDEAAHFIRGQFSDARITLPVELNEKQLKGLSYADDNSEWIVYGYQTLMVTAQCMQENSGDCINKRTVFSGGDVTTRNEINSAAMPDSIRTGNPSFVLRDRKNQSFYTTAICKYCYNILFNGVPTVLYDMTDHIRRYKGSLRFQFTRENVDEMRAVLDSFFAQQVYEGAKTRGHYRRGVE